MDGKNGDYNTGPPLKISDQIIIEAKLAVATLLKKCYERNSAKMFVTPIKDCDCSFKKTFITANLANENKKEKRK